MYSDHLNLISGCQSGFRKGYSTLDNIILLHFLSQTLMHCKKKLFCAFIDFKQAFDTVWREGLWFKIYKSGITGKCLTFLKNMYNGIKSKVKLNDETSPFFFCNLGVRQGENLSPFLFSMYINDIENFLNEKNVNGLSSITNDLEEELLVYCKLFILFYADDTVILTESAQDLQHALDEFCIYCKYWKLTVNVKKTKVMIFSKGPAPKCSFMYNSDTLEVVKEYNYLGIIFSRSGSFCKAKKHLCTQSQKAMYGIIRKIRFFDMSFDIQLDLFDKVVLPVLLYSCEIWG